MTVSSKNPTTNSVIVTGWTNPTYIYNEDGTQLGTCAPAKGAYVTSDYGGFDFSNIPDGATINSFTVVVKAKASTGALTVLSLLWQPWSGGSAIGSEYSKSQLTTSLVEYNNTWALTAAQIKSSDFKIRLRGYRSGNTAYTLSADFIRVTVDYKVVLSIDNVSQAQVIDSVTLTAHVPNYSLVIQDIAQVQGIENLNLTYHQATVQLSIQDISQAQIVDGLALTQHNKLAIDNIAQSQAVENITLTGHVPTFSLTIADITQLAVISSPDLIQHNHLSINDIVQGQSIENIGLTYHAPGGKTLAIADVLQGQAVENTMLIQHHLLDIQGIFQPHEMEEIILTYHKHTPPPTPPDQSPVSDGLHFGINRGTSREMEES